MANVSLWLDDYDDIYSDFDSRNYLKRRISEDFLNELRLEKKFTKEQVTDLQLFLPQEKRNDKAESLIINSLNTFFKDQFQGRELLYKKKLNAGIKWLGLGMLVMAVNSYVSIKGAQSLLLTVIRVLLEPGGWFLIWLAFDLLFYNLSDIRKDKEFFHELMRANIHFKPS